MDEERSYVSGVFSGCYDKGEGYGQGLRLPVKSGIHIKNNEPVACEATFLPDYETAFIPFSLLYELFDMQIAAIDQSTFNERIYEITLSSFSE